MPVQDFDVFTLWHAIKRLDTMVHFHVNHIAIKHCVFNSFVATHKVKSFTSGQIKIA